MKKLLASLILIFAALWSASAFAAAGAVQQQPIQIAAAANLTKVFTEQIIPAFTKKTGIAVQPTFGATGLLARQMESGAPYQVFVSADTSTPALLSREKLLDPASVKTFVIGRLVLWSKSLPVKKEGFAVLTTDAVKDIAVANPKTAPYGLATIQTLNKLNLLSTVQPKIVYAENISQALQFAQSGNAEVGFTALSLVQGTAAGNYYLIPEKLHEPIEQAEGVAPGAAQGALQFAEFLISKDAQKIFASAGYMPPKSKK